MSETPITDKTKGRKHTYHSEANVLTGFLTLPLNQKIQPQAYANLPGEGGYFDQRLENYKLGEVISIRSAYTQVAGNLDPKEDKGWSTLTTTVVEGFNVLDVLTADRIVGQIITEYPLVGYIPKISFLGTRFENLRIAGHPVDLKLDLDFLGSAPAGDKSYTDSDDLKKRIEKQVNDLGEHKSLLEEVRKSYNQFFLDPSKNAGKPEPLECSLVNQATVNQAPLNQATGKFPGTGCGHVISIPNFGTIVLAKVRLSYEEVKTEKDTHRNTTVHLTMIDMKLGCGIAGHGGVGSGSSNGGTTP
jgi:hypothetical protein